MDHIPFWACMAIVIYLAVLAIFERDDWGE